MSAFKVFHKGSYYRLSAQPVSFKHLGKVLQKITDGESALGYFFDDFNVPREMKNEEDFKEFISERTDEKVVYTEMPTRELADYIDLKKSILINPGQALTELIRQEILKQSQVLPSGPVHKGSVCSNCSESPIVGIKYTCQSCKIDFCEKCEEISQVHSHPLLKFRSENQSKSPSSQIQLNPFPPPKNPNPRPSLQEKQFGAKKFEAAKTLKDLGFQDDRVNLEALECNDYEIEAAIDYILMRQ
jgi:hypothetical protein